MVQSRQDIGSSVSHAFGFRPVDRRQLLDPVVNQPQAALVRDRRTDARHPSRADLCHAVKQDGPVRISRRQKARVRYVECPLSRTDADGSRVAHVERRQQLELGVSAAPLAMAVRAVGVQIRPGPSAEVLLLGAVVREPREFFGSRAQRIREDAKVLQSP